MKWDCEKDIILVKEEVKFKKIDFLNLGCFVAFVLFLEVEMGFFLGIFLFLV